MNEEDINAKSGKTLEAHDLRAMLAATERIRCRSPRTYQPVSARRRTIYGIGIPGSADIAARSVIEPTNRGKDMVVHAVASHRSGAANYAQKRESPQFTTAVTIC